MRYWDDFLLRFSSIIDIWLLMYIPSIWFIMELVEYRAHDISHLRKIWSLWSDGNLLCRFALLWVFHCFSNLVEKTVLRANTQTHRNNPWTHTQRHTVYCIREVSTPRLAIAMLCFEAHSRMFLVRSSSKLIVHCTGNVSKSIPCPWGVTKRECTKDREASSSFRAAQIWRQGPLEITLRQHHLKRDAVSTQGPATTWIYAVGNEITAAAGWPETWPPRVTRCAYIDTYTICVLQYIYIYIYIYSDVHMFTCCMLVYTCT